MYQGLPDNANRTQFETLLCETIEIVKSKVRKNHDELFNIILMQLEDIKENIVDKQILTDEDEINERYTLGAIAIKNFDEDPEMESRLCDIFGGAIEYAYMPDKS